MAKNSFFRLKFGTHTRRAVAELPEKKDRFASDDHPPACHHDLAGKASHHTVTTQGVGLLRKKQQPRVAASSLEVLVAFTLLTCVLSLSVPLVVRHGRLLSAQRDYRLALDELSNQLDRLGALPLPELPAALRILTPSPFVAERLPGAELTAELKPIDLGTRLTLRLSWDEPERHQAPVTMTGWILPESPPASDQTAEDDAS